MAKKLLYLSLILNIFFLSFYTINKVKFLSRQNANFKYSYNRDQYFRYLPKDNNQIVFIGDSQTEFFELQEMFKSVKIVNRGISGDNTAGVLDRLGEILETKPKKVFIEIGVNDLIKKVPVSKTAENINSIVMRIQKETPNTKIYLESIFPTKGGIYAQNISDSVKELNSKIKSLPGVEFIDVYPSFESNGELKKEYDCGDGLHLSGPGYQKWKEILEPYVKE